jgi:oxygen-independent coproporphyrinogen-3 oxidase
MDLGVYIHFPYCRALCPYCNFNSHVVASIPHRAYADAIIGELRTRAAAVRGRRLVSVYFGGGTPGLWQPDEVQRVLAAVEEELGPLGDSEITVEVNPGSLDENALPALRAAGANRLSVGCQSLHDRHLHRLGRLHSAADALRVLRLGREAAFRSMTADFLFALPDQSLEEWVADLDRIAALGVPHLSLYNLTIEPETPLASWVRRGQIVPATDDLEADMLVAARARLRAAGYEHYEISNYALPGHRAVHNSLYWLGAEYLGLGAGAHGFVRTDRGGFRFADVDDPADYMARVAAGALPEAWREHRTREDLVLEMIMTGLRWLDGLDFTAFARKTGCDLRKAYPDVLVSLEQDGLAEISPERLRLTESGLLLLNRVVLRFFPDDGARGGELVETPRA